MAEDEYEPIFRRIRFYEERIRNRAETISYFESILSIRREETGLTHWQLMRADESYRHTFYSVRALRGWQTRDRKSIAELRKIIPPVKKVRVILTFSIETGEGHEPFFAEVTCDTVIGIELSLDEQDEIIKRIINAIIKLFWILFDVVKDVMHDDRDLWGAEAYDHIVRRARFFQKYAYEIYEYAMDNLIRMLMELGRLQRPTEEYVTKHAILKIGVEYEVAGVDAEPKYPTINVLIEKGTSAETKGQWIIEKQLLIAEKTDINMLIVLNMEMEK